MVSRRILFPIIVTGTEGNQYTTRECNKIESMKDGSSDLKNFNFQSINTGLFNTKTVRSVTSMTLLDNIQTTSMSHTSSRMLYVRYIEYKEIIAVKILP